MKTYFWIIFIGIACCLQAQAQDKQVPILPKQTWFLETSISPASSTSELLRPSTGFGFNSAEGDVNWTVGAEGGVFIADNLAVKLGLGLSGGVFSTVFSYKAGVKYFAWGRFPIQVDYSGASGDFLNSVNFLGLQAGHAIFLNDKIALEPSLRYNIDLGAKAHHNWAGQVGFSLFFNRKTL